MIEETETEPEMLRIKSISVEGLFGLYDHMIPLNLENRATIIHGPNGVGKTKVLEWIDAMFRWNHSVFLDVPFRRFKIELDDNTSLEVEPLDDDPEHPVPVASTDTSPEDPFGVLADPVLSVRLHNPDGTTHEHGIRPAALRALEALSRLPWLTRTGPDSWFDERRGRTLSTEDVFALTRDEAPWASPSDIEPPTWLKHTLDRVDVVLIETHRLTHERLHSSRSRVRQEVQIVPAVEDCAKDLHRTIREGLAEYANTSQAMDQSFPQRLLAFPSAEINTDDLKHRMRMLDEMRARLTTIGLLQDDGPSHPFDVNTLDEIEGQKRIVLAVYIENTEAKLATLDDLAERIALFLDNINEKFINKRIHVDHKAGLIVEDGNGRTLALSDLSSGEQHEIVLLYDLLFNVRPNTLVLIDEPELSLHITWQKRFLDDLLQITKTVGIDALVATHSPFIIGEREDLMVPLEATPVRR